MICLIRQPAGLGDIIFCQKIAQHYIDKGYEVYWPIIDFYYDTVLKYFEDNSINFCREDEDFPMKEYYLSGILQSGVIEDTDDVYLALQHTDRVSGVAVPYDILDSKYRHIELNHNGWQNYFNIKRNLKKENHLFYDVLKLNDDSEYNIVNRWFGTSFDGFRDKMHINNNISVVEMNDKKYSLFDWCKVFENATEIHTVDTSLSYIFEKLNLKAKRKCLYSRNNPSDSFFRMKKIFTNVNWEYVL